jgi:hypothetical protein
MNNQSADILAFQVKKTRRSKIKKEGSDDNEALERAIKEEFFDASEA